MNNKKTGFTFSEIAIVMILIGILIAAIANRYYIIGIANLSKIRSISASSPVNEIEGNTIWIDIANKKAFTSYPSNKEAVSSLLDVSVNLPTNIQFLQNNINFQPKFLFDTNDGLPFLSFNQATMSTSGAIEATKIFGLNEVTVFVVQRYVSGGGSTVAEGTIFEYQNSSGGDFTIAPRAYDQKLYFYYGSSSGAGVASNNIPSSIDNKWQIISISKVSGASSLTKTRINGQDISSQTINSSAFVLGGSGNIILSKSTVNTDFRELIIFKRQLSDEEIMDVERYLSKKWSIAID